MNALMRSEILRFRSRTLVGVVVVGGLLLVVIVLGLAVWWSEKPAPEELEYAHAALAECPQDARGEQFTAYGNYYGNLNYVDPMCFTPFRSMAFAPTNSIALAMLPAVYLGSSVIFVAIGICFGASLVGADWHHRSMTTLLTWESRRWRVYVARMATVVGGTFVIVLGLEIVWGLALAGTAAVKGTLFGIDGAWFRSTLEIGLRVAIIAAVTAALAASLAMISRSTGAALGLLIAYFTYEQLMQAINPTKNFWVLGRSFAVFVSADTRLAQELKLDLPAASAALLMYSAACLLVGYVVFSIRDVP